MNNNNTILYEYKKIKNLVEEKENLIKRYGKKSLNFLQIENNELIVQIVLPEYDKSYIRIEETNILHKYSLEDIGTKRIIFQDKENGNINIIYHSKDINISEIKEILIKDNKDSIKLTIGDYYYSNYDIIDTEGLKNANIIINGNYLLIQKDNGKVYIFNMQYDLPYQLFGQLFLEKNTKIVNFEIPNEISENDKMELLPYESYKNKDFNNIIIEFYDTYLIYTRNAQTLDDFVKDEEQLFSANSELNLRIAENLINYGKNKPVIYKNKEGITLLVFLDKENNYIFYELNQEIGYNTFISNMNKDNYKRNIAFIGHKYLVVEVKDEEERFFLEIYQNNLEEGCKFIYSTFNNSDKKDKSGLELFYINEFTGLLSFYYIENNIIKYNFVLLEDEIKINEIYSTLDLLYLGKNFFFDANKKILFQINKYKINKYKIKEFYSDKYKIYFLGKNKNEEFEFNITF